MHAVRQYSDGGGAMSVMKSPAEQARESHFWWPTERAEVRFGGSRPSAASSSSSKWTSAPDVGGVQRAAATDTCEEAGEASEASASSSEGDSSSPSGLTGSPSAALMGKSNTGKVKWGIAVLLACVALALLCVLAYYRLRSWRRTSSPPTDQEQPPHVRFAAPNCTDTANWTNGWEGCVVEPGGHDPEACKPHGWTCQAYAEKGWCRNGTTATHLLGDKFHHPENNCCVCGGGAWVGTASTAVCKANPKCPQTADHCCPTQFGTWLECCLDRPPVTTSAPSASSLATSVSPPQTGSTS